MRLVLDTNVVASGLLWGGPPKQLLGLGLGRNIQFFSSPQLLAELTDILSRAKFEEKIAASLLTVDEIVDLYAGIVTLVRPIPVARLAPDPDDDVVIGTAIAAKAKFIVTGDKGLVSVAEYEGGRVISVREALDAVLGG
jgi:putative PIN family toxin of toxin-antitoxin system